MSLHSLRLSSVLSLLLLLVATNSTKAALIVDVTGQVGTGVTTWSFSGSFDVQFGGPTGGGGSGGGSTPFAAAIPFIWDDFAPFFLPKAGNPGGDVGFLPGGTAAFQGSSSGLESIGGLFLQEDGAADDFGVFGSGGAVVFGETLSFSGASQLPIDIQVFDGVSSFPTTFNGVDAGNLGVEVPLLILFNAAPVPEPSQLLLLGTSLICALGARSWDRRIDP